jgi:hypothetical protein
MKRWGIALAAGVLLSVVSQGNAQIPTNSVIPTGGNGLTYAPVSTSSLSTPLPYSVVQAQPTFRDHVHGFFNRFLPGFLQPKSPLPAPQSPVNSLPNIPQTAAGTPLSPTFTIPVTPPKFSPNIR